MPFEPTPWAVSQTGAVHKADVLRNYAYIATRGETGVGGPGDGRVRALATPGTSVRIAPGSFVAVNASVTNQSYTGYALSETLASIDPVSANVTRRDMVIARVVDPQYEGAPLTLEQVATFQFFRPDVLKNVPATAISSPIEARRYLRAQNITGVPLAGVTMAAGSGGGVATVLDSYLKDLRDVAMPKFKDDVLGLNMVDGYSETLTATAAAGEYFPDGSAGDVGFQVYIPPWATRLKLSADWSMVRHRPTFANGEMWVRIGSPTDSTSFTSVRSKWDTPTTTDEFRGYWKVTDGNIAVPAAARDSIKQVILYARLINTANANSRPIIDGATNVSVNLRWLEAATLDV